MENNAQPSQDKASENGAQIPAPTGENRKIDGTFAKGHSGNPNGRPPGTLSLTTILREELEKVPKGEKVERARKMIRKMIKDAENGSAHDRKLIMNYVEGLPKQPIDLGVDKESLGELTKFFQTMAKPEEEGEDDV